MSSLSKRIRNDGTILKAFGVEGTDTQSETKFGITEGALPLPHLIYPPLPKAMEVDELGGIDCHDLQNLTMSPVASNVQTTSLLKRHD